MSNPSGQMRYPRKIATNKLEQIWGMHRRRPLRVASNDYPARVNPMLPNRNIPVRWRMAQLNHRLNAVNAQLRKIPPKALTELVEQFDDRLPHVLSSALESLKHD